jgi:putative tryptophan/tyrosine transport system substrate-binding protein
MSFDQFKRRDFITLLGGAAAAWPLAARAQRSDRMRHIGVFLPSAANDPASMSRVTALSQALQGLGWTDGRNVRIEFRWGAGDAEQYRRMAAELIALGPDVVVTVGTLAVSALERATRTVPIVFVQTTDPVGGGLVDNLARPGGNVTGFAAREYVTAGKNLELLKQIAPRLTRAAVTRDSGNSAGTAQFAAIQTVASSLQMELRPFDVRDAGEIERAVTAFAQAPNGGLIVTPSAPSEINRGLLISLAAKHRLPAIYPYRFYVADGGLMSYGIDEIDQFRLAAHYVDRILKGEKPADLPVQQPTKFELVVNLKTVKALGLDVPPTMLTLADEVIE